MTHNILSSQDKKLTILCLVDGSVSVENGINYRARPTAKELEVIKQLNEECVVVAAALCCNGNPMKEFWYVNVSGVMVYDKVCAKILFIFGLRYTIGL